MGRVCGARGEGQPAVSDYFTRWIERWVSSEEGAAYVARNAHELQDFPYEWVEAQCAAALDMLKAGGFHEMTSEDRTRYTQLLGQVLESVPAMRAATERGDADTSTRLALFVGLSFGRFLGIWGELPDAGRGRRVKNANPSGRPGVDPKRIRCDVQRELDRLANCAAPKGRSWLEQARRTIARRYNLSYERVRKLTPGIRPTEPQKVRS